MFRSLIEKARSLYRASLFEPDSFSDRQDAYFKCIVENIDTYGWHLTFVSDSDPDSLDPSFGYTVGFPKSFNAPDIIIFGLPHEVVHPVLREMFSQIEAGEVVEDGKRWAGLLEGFDCITRKAVHPDLFEEYALSSDWHWKHEGHEGFPEVYQLVWPGSQQGLFPWEDGCVESVSVAQPALWLD